MSAPAEHERELVRSFILPERQGRYLELLAKPKRRKDITNTLAHFKHVDMRFAVQIPSHQQHAANILQILQSKGAPENCYALSEDSDLDGRYFPLRDALASVVGNGMGTFLSCIPGKLAYFEDEEDRWILERKAKTRS